MTRTIETPYLIFKKRQTIKRVFREQRGIAPMQLVVRQRMNRATQALVNTDRKVYDIAEELGYQSLHSFTRLFTEHVGMSPGVYRLRFGHAST